MARNATRHLRFRANGIVAHTINRRSKQGILKHTYHIKTTEDRIRLVVLTDPHLGAPENQCDIAKLKAEINYILETPNTYAIILGDLCDCAQKMPGKKGPSVFLQSLPPQDQVELAIELLQKLAEKKKILGIHAGNHELWIFELTGIDIVKIIADRLNVPYLGPACDTTIHLYGKDGKSQKYLIYSQHGNSSAKLKHTKLGALIAATKDIFADLFLWGHVHQIAAVKGGKRWNGHQIKCYYVLCGHFLKWEGSYAQMFGMDICPAGAPKIQLFADKKDVHVVV